MRGPRDRSDALGEIAALCALQRRAYEIEAHRAATAHSDAKDRHDACLAKLSETEARWAEAVESGSFDPRLTRIWFSALAQGHEEERRLQAEVADMHSVLERERAAWRTAAARSDAAREQSEAASRQVMRQRDEARLAALEDRVALRARRR